jgi:hypothetical protein
VPKLNIVLSFATADQPTAQGIVDGLQSQFPNIPITAFYQDQLDTSAQLQTQQQALLAAQIQVASDPGVINASVAAYRAASLPIPVALTQAQADLPVMTSLLGGVTQDPPANP